MATSALAPLGGLAAGCSSLDQLILGENRDESDKVVILGAGLAGLTAAFHLKRNQQAFRLYEASSRTGGRVMTIRDLNVSSRHGELGGEKIEADHSAIQGLAQDLKISLAEFSPKESVAWFEKGQVLSPSQWRKESAELVKLFQQVQNETYGNGPQLLNFQNRDQYPKAVILDRMSVSELLSRLRAQIKPWMKPFLEQMVRSEWGVEPQKISSLHLLHWMRDSFRPLGKKYFKVKGGSSVLTQALLDRVSGVVPERFVRFQHQLVQIRKNETNWSLFFQTPTGRTEIKTQKIICTLPPTLLRQVEGWEQIPLSSEKKKLLSQQDLGSHGKVLLSFQERFWKDSSLWGTGGTLYTDLLTASLSEAGDPVTAGIGGLHGVLQGQMGGDVGAQAGLHSVTQMLKDLAKVEDKAVPFEDISYVQNWKAFAWSRGSRAYLQPGQFQLFDISNANDGWILAGEAYNLSFMGTMNGAVLTALEAAIRFLKTSG